MLQNEQTVLIVIDVQERLVPAMHEAAFLVEQVSRTVRGIRALDVPVLCTEQIPEKLGATVPEIADVLNDRAAIAKNTFGCCGAPVFMEALESLGRRQVLLCGIETHVCVYQTAMELLDHGYEVHLIADAVSSRTARNRDIAVERLRDEGAVIASAEMVFFELQRIAEGDTFKQLLRIVKV